MISEATGSPWASMSVPVPAGSEPDIAGKVRWTPGHEVGPAPKSMRRRVSLDETMRQEPPCFS